MVLVDMHRPLNVVLLSPAVDRFHVGCDTWLIYSDPQELAVFSNVLSVNRRLQGCSGGA